MSLLVGALSVDISIIILSSCDTKLLPLAYRTYSYEVGPDHSNRKVVPAHPAAQPTADAIQLKKIAARAMQQQQQQQAQPKQPMAYGSSGLVSRPTPLFHRATFGVEAAEIFSVETEMDGFM